VCLLQELGWTRKRSLFIGCISAALVGGVIIGLNADDIIEVTFVPLGRFNIAAAGDWGCDINAVNTVSNIKSQNPEIVLALGDLSYEGDTYFTTKCPHTSSWFDIVNPIIKSMKFVIGNHDLPISTVVPDLLKQYQKKFKLCPIDDICNTFYSFNKGGVHFLIMNSEEEYPIKRTGPQYSFVEADLKAASSNPSIKWIIVAFHSPMYSLGLNPFATAMPHIGTDYEVFVKDFREAYHPLFDKYGVDLVLQGHSHSYQRTYPLIFDSATEPSLAVLPHKKPPLVTSTSNDTYVNPRGEIYLTVGTAGIGLDSLTDLSIAHFITDSSGSDKPITDNHFLAKVDNNNFGFLDLELSEDQSSLTGIFYSNALAPVHTSMNESRVASVTLFHRLPTMGHKVIDYFTISKS